MTGHSLPLVIRHLSVAEWIPPGLSRNYKGLNFRISISSRCCFIKCLRSQKNRTMDL